MKAVRFHRYGDSDVLTYEDAEKPAAGPGEVVVKVAGTSFNPVDVAIRAGYLQQVFPLTFPHVPGIDVAGTIEQIGAHVTGVSPGSPVVAFLPMNAPGSAAEYVTVPAEALAAAPRTGDLADAAALPSAGLTAYQSLFDHAGLRSGQSILINGAGGGVGGYAVQLAKLTGATVTATAGERSADRLRGYGADRIIDYTATPVLAAAAGQQFDVVLNLVTTAPAETAELTGLVKDAGVLVSTTTPAPEDTDRQVRTVRVFARSDAGQLTELVRLVDAGDLRIDVAARRPLADLVHVHDEAVTGRLAGKTILTTR